ncbi:MAG: TraR/DksA family transcriptional regulator, partial [Deltaproteobacteria bacterium]|nr:TraR/DksA family transcriptional regulator [Deltaproteobacteria bacterium]
MTTPKAMTPKQMKKMLLDMRAQLLQGISENVKAESGTEKTEIGDLYDLATSERDRELSLLLGDRDRAKLKEIDSA